MSTCGHLYVMAISLPGFPLCPLWLKILEQFRSGILRIQLRQLAQQFFRLFISRHRNSHFDFDDLISATAFFGC